MDIGLRPVIQGAIDVKRRGDQRKHARYRVVTEDRCHPVMELTDSGFVIEADGRPPLRGYIEIFRGDSRIDRRLVVCDWVRDGLVGYEFKRSSAGSNVPADHVASAIAGLISGPAH